MVNLLKVIKTEQGKVNCYVTDTLADRDSIEDTTMGIMVFVIEDGQYYKKTSSGGWFKIYTGNERVPKNKGCVIINVDKEMTFGMPIAVFDPDENDIFCRLDRYDPTGHRIVIKDVPVGKYNDLKLVVLKDDRKYSGKILQPFEVTADQVLEFDMVLEPEFLPEYSGEIEVRVSKKESPVFYRMLADISTEEGMKDTTVVASFNPPIEASCRIRNDGEYKTIVIDNIPLQEYKYLKILAYRNDTVFKGMIKESFKVEDNIINKLEIVLEEERTPILPDAGMVTITVDKDLTGGSVDVVFNPTIKNTVFTVFKNEITVENIPNGEYKTIKVLATKDNKKYSGYYKNKLAINSKEEKISINLESEDIPALPKNSGTVTVQVDKDMTGGFVAYTFGPNVDKSIFTIHKNEVTIEGVPNGTYKTFKIVVLRNDKKFTGFYKRDFVVNGDNTIIQMDIQEDIVPIPEPGTTGIITAVTDKDISGAVAAVIMDPPAKGVTCTVKKNEITLENVPNGKYNSIDFFVFGSDKQYGSSHKGTITVNNNDTRLNIVLKEGISPTPPTPVEGGKIKINASDNKPGYLFDKLVGAPGSGITFSVDSTAQAMVAHFDTSQYEAKILETMDATSALSMLNHQFGTGCLAGTIMFPEHNMAIKKDVSKALVYSLGMVSDEFRISIYKLENDGSLYLVGYTSTTKFGEEKVGRELPFIYVNPKNYRITAGDIYYVCIHKLINSPTWGKLLGLTGVGTPTITNGDIQFTIKDLDNAGFDVTSGKNPAERIPKNYLKENVEACYTYFRITNP